MALWETSREIVHVAEEEEKMPRVRGGREAGGKSAGLEAFGLSMSFQLLGSEFLNFQE